MTLFLKHWQLRISYVAPVAVGSTKTGINMDAVRDMGIIVKKTAELTKDNDALGCAKLVIFCNPVEDNPFMAGAFLWRY